MNAAPPVAVRYYERDASVFLDHEYLTRGVAGAIFWKLVREHAQQGRTEFTTRELRLAGAELRLPDGQPNLDARLRLLRRRLEQQDAPARLEPAGRGRYRLATRRELRPCLMGAAGRADQTLG